MYPMTPTETERLVKMIQDQAPKITETIGELMQQHQAEVTAMLQGVRYYYNENETVMNKQRKFFKDGKEEVDKTKPNNRIPHGWHKLLVDQKVGYLTGNPIAFSAEDEDLQQAINDRLGDEWDDTASELVLNASNKGIEWLHPFIDEDGNFDYVIIPAEQFIPIYDQRKRKKLTAGIRFYSVGNVTKIEVYDEKRVTFYEQVDGGEIVLDVMYGKENPAPHFSAEFVDQGRFGYGWGRVPFIAFKNNEAGVSDLKFTKQLIDAYDKVVSGTADDIEEIQNLIYVLKGYEGESLSEFMENLRYYKAISLAAEEGAGVDTITAESPIQTIDSHLNRLEESIYTFGQGVNTRTDKFGSNPSGVALKFLYSLLDLKTKTLESKFKKGLKEFMWFLVEYLKMANIGEYDYKDISFTFNKSMITNEAEQITNCKDSTGIISDETILANHPWVDDPAEEMQRLKEQQEDEINLYRENGGGTNAGLGVVTETD